MTYEIFYSYNSENVKIYSIWSTISSYWVIEDAPKNLLLAVMQKLGLEGDLEKDWIDQAEPKDNLNLFVIPASIIKKYAEKEN